MTVQLLDPAGTQPAPYRHVAVGTGTRLVTVAGQIAWDRDGGDGARLPGQVAQALENTSRALAAAGATFADVVRLTFYVTAWTPDQMDDFMAGVDRVSARIGLPVPMPPASLIGVDVLFEPGVRVEVEATAVCD